MASYGRRVKKEKEQKSSVRGRDSNSGAADGGAAGLYLGNPQTRPREPS